MQCAENFNAISEWSWSFWYYTIADEQYKDVVDYLFKECNAINISPEPTLTEREYREDYEYRVDFAQKITCQRYHEIAAIYNSTDIR